MDAMAAKLTGSDALCDVKFIRMRQRLRPGLSTP